MTGKEIYRFMKRRFFYFYTILLTLFMHSCSHKENVDVLIVGGGASGVAAGVQSARMGVNTLIIEQTPWLGGMLTSAGVSCVDGNYNLRGGIFGEFADSLCAHYGSWEALKTGWVSHINFEPHVGQEIFSNMAEACAGNLEVMRETHVLSLCKLEEGGGRVVAESADGRRTVEIRYNLYKFSILYGEESVLRGNCPGKLPIGCGC